jgi:hypothetical protein
LAGSITVTTADLGGLITRYTVAWTSSAGGAVSGTTFDCKAGHLMQVRQLPDSGGTQPTDQYDVTVLDGNSVDVLAGGGANLSNAAPTYTTPALTAGYPVFVEAGALTPTVANAGNAKGGQIVLYVSTGDSLALGTAAQLAASDPSQTDLAAVSGSITLGNAAKFADTSGTVADAGLALGSAAALALIAGFAKHALVAGAAAGDVTVSGIKTTDTLNAVLRFIGAGVAVTDLSDLTSQFTITANGKINNTGGTASSGDKLLVLWTATS